MTGVVSRLIHGIELSLTSLVIGGVLEKFSRLKIVSAEKQCSLNTLFPVPHQTSMQREEYKVSNCTQAEREYISKRQVNATLIDDPVFVNLLDWYPLDNIMWSSDYPHDETTKPRSQDYVARHIRQREECLKIIAGGKSCAMTRSEHMPA